MKATRLLLAALVMAMASACSDVDITMPDGGNPPCGVMGSPGAC